MRLPIDYKDDAKICPDSPGDEQPWLPDEFEVVAVIRSQAGETVEIPLRFMSAPEADTPGQFAGTWDSPPSGIAEITVYAFQASTGNTGVDMATVILPAAAASA